MDLPGLGPCIEMEWVDGITLQEALQEGRPDRKTFRKWASELCDALSCLHQRQMVHRDLKPSNIMVTHDGRSIKLIDFGLADRADSAVLRAPAGTLRFVAPEVAEGQIADARSDIYSLGKVLREMTQGHRRVIRRCVRKDPEKRYPSAQAVKEALFARHWIPGAILFAGLLVLAALLLRDRTTPAPDAPPSAPGRDTVIILQREPSGNQTETKQPQQKKDGDPDRIFQQATDLFEEYL